MPQNVQANLEKFLQRMSQTQVNIDNTQRTLYISIRKSRKEKMARNNSRELTIERNNQ